jgi:hypothetical protein
MACSAIEILRASLGVDRKQLIDPGYEMRGEPIVWVELHCLEKL